MNDRFETALAESLQPAPLPLALRDRLEAIPQGARTPAPAQRRIARPAIWLAAATTAAAAAVAAALVALAPPKGAPHGDAPPVVSPAALAELRLISTDRFLLSAEDLGIQRSPGEVPLHKKRYRFIDVHTLQSPDGETAVRYTRPTDETYIVPVRFD